MSNICERCGGQKTVYLRVEPVFSNGYTPAIQAVSASSMRICTCPIPEPKHDGILQGRNTYIVSHIFGLDMPEVASIRIGHDEVSNDEVWLSPAQALSLLAWLKQEQETLEQLAQQQEGEQSE